LRVLGGCNYYEDCTCRFCILNKADICNKLDGDTITWKYIKEMRKALKIISPEKINWGKALNLCNQRLQAIIDDGKRLNYYTKKHEIRVNEIRN
jgi:hypothetical protein